MSTGKGLNPKQRAFIKNYVTHGSALRAAKEAGYSIKSSSDAAFRLLRNKQVKQMIEEARIVSVKETGYTLAKAMEEAKDVMDFAKETENANAYAKAVELRSKLNGLLVEKHDVRQVGFHVNVGGIDFNKRDALPGSEAPQLETKDVPEISEGTDSAEDLFDET